jgi:hypothetical protein
MDDEMKSLTEKKTWTLREIKRVLHGKGLATLRKGGKDWPDPQQKA